jgi:enamine deaminase RidA (YjgF/YER057c/UK114 family)
VKFILGFISVYKIINKIMKQLLAYIILMLASTIANAQLKQHINPDGVNKPKTYSQVVKVNGGSMIFTSGIVADDTNGNIIGKGDLKAQVKQAFDNLKIVLAAAGAEFKDVVKMTYYVVNYKPEQIPMIREVRANYLPTENPPASTLVGVAALFNADVLIEIEAVAVVKKLKKK